MATAKKMPKAKTAPTTIDGPHHYMTDLNLLGEQMQNQRQGQARRDQWIGDDAVLYINNGQEDEQPGHEAITQLVDGHGVA